MPNHLYKLMGADLSGSQTYKVLRQDVQSVEAVLLHVCMTCTVVAYCADTDTYQIRGLTRRQSHLLL